MNKEDEKIIDFVNDKHKIQIAVDSFKQNSLLQEEFKKMLLKIIEENKSEIVKTLFKDTLDVDLIALNKFLVDNINK